MLNLAQLPFCRAMIGVSFKNIYVESLNQYCYARYIVDHWYKISTYSYAILFYR